MKIDVVRQRIASPPDEGMSYPWIVDTQYRVKQMICSNRSRLGEKPREGDEKSWTVLDGAG